jgi:hypothetical protein
MLAMEQFGSFADSKFYQKKWQLMEHFEFLIVPDPSQHPLSAFPHHSVYFSESILLQQP